jgi:isopenicillin N synthase-like dioxygenase
MTTVDQIDLRDYFSDDTARQSRFREALRAGLVDTGFIRVVGHAVEEAQVGRVHALFERFFAQPDSVKSRCAGVLGGQRGFTPLGIEHAKGRRAPDPKEFYHVGQELADESPLRSVYAANIWPDELPELRPACADLYRALEACASHLLRALAESFLLPRDVFSSMLVDGNSILRSIHYPPVPPADGTAESDGATLRAAPHQDINLITLLCGATDAGLEILTPRDEWVEVQTEPGEIIADAGDMLARITNDRIPATTHRVVASAESRRRHRYALPFFAHPRPECDLSVIDRFVPPGQEPVFPPITAGGFLEERLREIGLIS